MPRSKRSRATFIPTRRKDRPASARPADGSPADARSGAEAGELVGLIQFRTDGGAGVIPEGSASRTPIPIAAEDTAVALPGDRVRIRTFPSSDFRAAAGRAGRVTAVLERLRPLVVGEVRQTGRAWVVAPDDPRFPGVIEIAPPLPGDRPALRPGEKVAVKLGEWRFRHAPLVGVVTERLGRTHEPLAELRGVFVKFGLATGFPADVEREAAALPTRVGPGDLAGRLDLREIPAFTIDPDDAKDFDDALSVEPLGSGRMRIGVHIADVSAYVRPGTALDREARVRGNSTYLVGTVIPMLPERLSNGLCSLVEGEDRLCKSVLFTFARNGRIEASEFADTVIRSRKRLTYRQAYALLKEGDLDGIRRLPPPPRHQTGAPGRPLKELTDAELVDVQSWVRRLWTIGSRLRQARMAAGSLDLDMPETKIFVDAEGYADRLELIVHDESHQLVEEFMLAANEAVARHTRTHRLPSLYRVHDDPDDLKLDEYRQFVATAGIAVGDLTKREEVARLLQAIGTHPQGHMLRSQFLRSLKRACYRAEPDGHYGLAKKDYTHFTSPIRRYADLVTHRVLGAWLARTGGVSGGMSGGAAARGAGQVPHPLDAARAGALAEHLSLTEQNSMEAERESAKIKLLEYFEREVDRKPRTVFGAIITDVRRAGLFIELVESLAFGFIPSETLRDDAYSLDRQGSALVGRRSHRRLQAGERIDVVVLRVDRYRRMIDFEPSPRSRARP